MKGVGEEVGEQREKMRSFIIKSPGGAGGKKKIVLILIKLVTTLTGSEIHAFWVFS
ncbi:hypothetical protein [Trichormus azollae]|jgi:hypothetical protein|uniref:Uncharacterized protein n=1 Tax=Nostoc azollae (strain 0708) TaxID=551115 RepID=D7DZ78_NOSA0|nr:hypothetical protein [Trichormus azollae]ADI66099.1 hypothetical protein Aazo_4975 ['Nostoc azollae' 0708]